MFGERVGCVREMCGEDCLRTSTGERRRPGEHLIRDGAECVDVCAMIDVRIGCGLLVIDHDMRLIMRLSERIQVLNSGRTICEGTPDRVRTDPAVLTAYLGTGSHAVG